MHDLKVMKRKEGEECEWWPTKWSVPAACAHQPNNGRKA
jgi:hypothetical protein